MTKRPRSPESIAFERLLRTLTPGQQLSFDEMTAALNFDVTAYLGHLYRVRNTMTLRGDAVIEVVPKTGIRRLTDAEAINCYGPDQLKRISRSTRRGAGGVSSVNYAKLSPADQTKHNVTLARFGAVQMFSEGNRVEKKIAESPRPVHNDVNATLALFVKPVKKA